MRPVLSSSIIAARSIDPPLLCGVLEELSNRERAADDSEDPADDLGLVGGGAVERFESWCEWREPGRAQGERRVRSR